MTLLIARDHHFAYRVAMPIVAITTLQQETLVGATTAPVLNMAITMNIRTAQFMSSSNGSFLQSHWLH